MSAAIMSAPPLPPLVPTFRCYDNYPSDPTTNVYFATESYGRRWYSYLIDQDNKYVELTNCCSTCPGRGWSEPRLMA